MEYELYHHGILGMHWGIRRFQNKDGSLTAAGKKRYGDDASAQKEQYSVRRVTSVGSNRSRGVASLKAGLTKPVKILATAAAVGAGVYFVNSYIRAKGMGINFSSPEITNNIRKARKICKYAY